MSTDRNAATKAAGYDQLASGGLTISPAASEDEAAAIAAAVSLTLAAQAASGVNAEPGAHGSMRLAPTATTPWRFSGRNW